MFLSELDTCAQSRSYFSFLNEFLQANCYIQNFVKLRLTYITNPYAYVEKIKVKRPKILFLPNYFSNSKKDHEEYFGNITCASTS